MAGHAAAAAALAIREGHRRGPAARIPPGSVWADRTPREDGLTAYMWLNWDVYRTGGHGGIQLHWKERQDGSTP
ncbi:hypothetical protein AB0N62_39960 [Streptomyces sp. NPDC093982]|uniref:hypothetical protein n=1 Tax=Streptomyces sp. NPDC093982 TaxID=3155077 RepID=UPI0034444ABF